MMKMGEEVQRSEKEIFVELEALCASPGFIHAIAYICMRDNLIMYSGEIKAEDMANLYGRERLLRNEVNVLVGLMVKHEIDYSLPDEATAELYVKRSQELLDEIHQAMFAPMREAFIAQAADGRELLSSGTMLREAIFYGGESAFIFQYRDFARLRYGKDDAWMLANKGFTIGNAADVVKALHSLRNEKSTEIFHALKTKPASKLAYLSGDEFSAAELAARAVMPVEIVDRVLSSFAYPDGERNAQFDCVDGPNMAAILPLIRRDDRYILFNIFDLSEVLYQAPYFWMLKDKGYQPTASDHRGKYTEDFAEERLVSVFGRESVKTNINLVRSKKTVVGEIDVLVRFGDLAIVLQAKSKQLTAAARQGNEAKLHEDFGKAVQAACDQGYSCGQILLDPSVALEDASGNKISVEGEITQIYVICLVADHYPALAAQERQLLNFAPAERIAPPFVMDVFNLDAMAEMLDTPLRFLSYLDRRTKYHNAIMSSHELTILGYHLRQNLWLDGEYNAMVLEDDIGIDLELSMSVRREGAPGARTPPGVLTRIANTWLGRLVKQIERQPNAGMLALGFVILQMGEQAVVEISDLVDERLRRAVMDERSQNLTVQLGSEREGLTIHINSDPLDEAEKKLLAYCAARKYAQRSDSWFGLLLAPRTGEIRFGVHARAPWAQDDAMDEATKGMQPMRSTKSLPKVKKAQSMRKGPLPKVMTLNLGRNAACPCGSGKKSKRCCKV